VAAVCLAASVVPASSAGATAESDGEVTDETAEAASGVEVVRLWGKDRYATSLVVAGEFVRAVGGRVDRVVLASGRSDSSAAVAAALAGGIDAPLLLVPPDGLGSDALTLLADARVQEALVVDWSRELAEMALASTRRAGIRVARVAGESPAALSVAAGEIVGVKNPPASAQGTGEGPAGGRPDTVEGLALPTRQVRAVVLAGSREPAAAAVLAARARLPLLLTSEGSLPADITEFLGLHDVTHAVVVGPTATTTSDTLRQVEASGIEATVLGGHGLVGAAAAVAGFSTDDVTGRFASMTQRECPVGLPPTVGLARGPEDRGASQSMPATWDAYSAAPLLGQLCSPLLLTTPDELAVDANAVLYRAQHTGTTAVHVFGGSAAMRDAVHRQAAEPEIPIRVALSVPDPSSGDAGGTIAVIDERLDMRHYLLGSGLGSIGNLNWSPQQRHLAFTAHQDGTAGVFIYELATGDLWRLTPHNEHYYPQYDAFAWSDDGALLAANVDASQDTNENGITDRHEFQREILVADLSARDVRWLARGNVRSRHVGWSPGGHRLVVFREPLLMTGRFDGADLVEVVDVDSLRRSALDHPEHVVGAQWSPDAAQIALITDSSYMRVEGADGIVHVFNADGTAARVADRTAASILEWAPNGCCIAVYATVNGGIATFGPATGSLRQLTTPPRFHDRAGVEFLGWSPDSRRIIAAAVLWEQGNGEFVTDLLSINVTTGELASLPWRNSRARLQYGGHGPAGTMFAYGAAELGEDTLRLVLVESEPGGNAYHALDAAALFDPGAYPERPWWLGEQPPFEWSQLEWTVYGVAAVAVRRW